MKLLVVAGEASADLHAGHLVARLKRSGPVTLIGVGGDRLVEQGLAPVKHAREMAVVGLTEAVRKIPQTLRLIASLEKLAGDERPDAALLLDLPDFNLRLAPKLHAMGIPVIYYISPQVWAWRSGRVHGMSECIDLLLSILPFESDWYRRNAPEKLRVEYVGHPVLEEIPDLPYQPQPNRLAILPGSRESEWRTLFGPMIGAAAILYRENRGLEFRLPLAEPLRGNAFVLECLSPDGPFAPELRALGGSFSVVEEPAHHVLRGAKAAWIASGTATLEAGVVGVPMVVAYKVSAVTAFVFKHFVRYGGPVAMVNLIQGGLGGTERTVPELLQDQVSAVPLAEAMRGVLLEPNWSRMKSRLASTRSILQGGTQGGLPLDRAAHAIRSFLEARA
ncbi:MAG TPA: lipid-A-disaccharide synthase [Bdellovibrionota bacterium]|jgi:lipid-A-disaccharide synthase